MKLTDEELKGVAGGKEKLKKYCVKCNVCDVLAGMIPSEDVDAIIKEHMLNNPDHVCSIYVI